MRVFEPEAWVDIRGDFVISSENIEEIDIDKVVIRVDMLFDETLYFKKGG